MNVRTVSATPRSAGRQLARVERQRDERQQPRHERGRLVGGAAADAGARARSARRDRSVPGRARRPRAAAAPPPARGRSSCATRRRTCCARTGVVAADPPAVPVRRVAADARSAMAPPRRAPARPGGCCARCAGAAARGSSSSSIPSSGRWPGRCSTPGRAARTPSSGTGAGTASTTPTTRRRSAASGSPRYHEAAAERAALTIAASVRLAELEREAGRAAELVPLSADLFPAPDPAGHRRRRVARAPRAPDRLGAPARGHRADAGARPAPRRRVARRRGDAATRTTRRAVPAPNARLARRAPDEEAARLILCADVGIVPFKVEPFNDAGLPYRILKYARLGRRTVVAAARRRRHLVARR